MLFLINYVIITIIIIILPRLFVRFSDKTHLSPLFGDIMKLCSSSDTLAKLFSLNISYWVHSSGNTTLSHHRPRLSLPTHFLSPSSSAPKLPLSQSNARVYLINGAAHFITATGWYTLNGNHGDRGQIRAGQRRCTCLAQSCKSISVGFTSATGSTCDFVFPKQLRNTQYLTKAMFPLSSMAQVGSLQQHLKRLGL